MAKTNARRSLKENPLKDQLAEAPRGAGILLHITSLPSSFAIGDFGPEARTFADFLSKAGQKYWQLLPLNPTESGQGYSPYSAISSMAGNTLLISPEVLVIDNLLTEADIAKEKRSFQQKVDFEEAEKIKSRLFDKAYQNFIASRSDQQKPYHNFCKKEKYWLDDFALYVVLKQHHNNVPWYEWPKPFKTRQSKTLRVFTKENSEELDKIKWLQYIFHKQWHELKEYCHFLNIRLFGDLPYYVSYDSSDVWAHTDIFSLDEDGKPIGVAGVPPDYFNADGQLWGMPVFNWKALKKDGFRWWLQRIKKNIELYDLIRLDHFRAFADYWEVPANEATAVNGKWKAGPGAAFFNAVKKEFGALPFVAEDLGDINEAVYNLRDKFNLPGMKILHFAFGDNMATSDYIPHNFTENFIGYTGTHDNNTTRGWYRKELKAKDRRRLSAYAGKKVSDKDVHEVLGRMVYASVAKTVIIPMQDVLGLDESARMNTPASTANNWDWRFEFDVRKEELETRLQEWCILYNR